jgi:predicted TIM-barrel fold metal-dependent hydrolase
VTGRLGLAGAMITEYPLEHRRYDQPEYEPFWAAAAALDLPLSLHTATRRQGRIRGAGDKTLRDASSRATKAFYPALSMCDLIFSGVFERHPRLRVAIVEFKLAWAPHLLSTMDYTYRERHGEAIYRLEARSGFFGNPTRGTARRRRSARVHPASADRREQRWPSARARPHEG